MADTASFAGAMKTTYPGAIRDQAAQAHAAHKKKAHRRLKRR